MAMLQYPERQAWRKTDVTAKTWFNAVPEPAADAQVV